MAAMTPTTVEEFLRRFGDVEASIFDLDFPAEFIHGSVSANWYWRSEVADRSPYWDSIWSDQIFVFEDNAAHINFADDLVTWLDRRAALATIDMLVKG